MYFLFVFHSFVQHGGNLIPTSCSQLLFFISRFQIPWILCWDFVQTQLIPPLFPPHLAVEFKLRWWSNFSPFSTQQIPHIRQWISSKYSNTSKKIHYKRMEENLLQKDIQTRIEKIKNQIETNLYSSIPNAFGIESTISFPYPMLLDLMKIKFPLRQYQFK